ncbi:helix-turn-helix domain-containing protein [Thermococcus sp.]|uniref:GbsR/MarR family transcriptional regulator n=1 Tax=Thermococcus sp. TaxID=35749 RepID=UPI00262D3266|nr:helix-turn-helix domain-containing protein [Thermococcus sp.]
MTVVARMTLIRWDADDKKDRDQEDRRFFVEAVGSFFKRYGYDEVDGRVYGLLLLMGRPATMAELSKELGLSRSAVSISLKRLSRDYLVKYQKRGRVKYFSAVPAFLKKFLQQPKDILEHEVIPLENVVERMIARSDDPVRRASLEKALKNLKALECVLRGIIRLESEARCLNGSWKQGTQAH